MPIHKTQGGFQWGSHGKVYPNREGAVKQAIAAHANGFKEVPEKHKMNAIKKASEMANRK